MLIIRKYGRQEAWLFCRIVKYLGKGHYDTNFKSCFRLITINPYDQSQSAYDYSFIAQMLPIILASVYQRLRSQKVYFPPIDYSVRDMRFSTNSL